MSKVVCLDGEHAVAAAASEAALLAGGVCPACPDTELGPPTRTGVQVCPCCWSAWWTVDGVVACTPGAIVVEEPAPAPLAA